MSRPCVAGSTANSEHISDEHRCRVCGKGKDETNFAVAKGVKSWIVQNKCNRCKNKQHRGGDSIYRIRLAHRKERRKEFLKRWREEYVNINS